MNVNVRIDPSDIENFDEYDLVELYSELSCDEKSKFFKRINMMDIADISMFDPLKKIQNILYNLPLDESYKIVCKLKEDFKSQEEWEELVKSINS
ncbi:hypothetical protein F358_065 [Campylobacter phage F358]|uniref:Uncharacterized protein n=9 Tax=Fletchervirus TaxID=1636618 RepID=A0A7T3N3I7_9CAUD|nr:hypothetical protein F357_066 [Campylobacter phage F357]QPX64036.1 hypothetical protein F358_065 [Campylobacter phage F358]QPX64199.1 hypothetical protein F360_066 [Campylobacter phage F360]QPX64365.1 hypothetical protein F361_068 [Campylobacter phage F361]QPX65340.1 hypothetical protein F372_058 [Campylobacter phage F372]